MPLVRVVVLRMLALFAADGARSQPVPFAATEDERRASRPIRG